MRLGGRYSGQQQGGAGDDMADNAEQVTTDILTQVGLRGTGWSHGDIGWGRDQGWRVVRGF